MKYVAKLGFSNGDLVDVRGEFDTRAEAKEAALDAIGAYHVGYDILNECGDNDEEPIDETPRIHIRKIK